MDSECESRWVRAARLGDIDALQCLVERHYGSVYRYVLTALSFDQEAAADITQEAFIGAVSSIKRFRGESSFRTWVIGIATNQIRSAYRKARTRETVTHDVLGQHTECYQADSLESESDEFVRMLVNALPMGQRQALYLREFLGCTYSEIAITLGIGVGAAKNRVIEARRNMMEEARARAPDEFERFTLLGCANAKR